MVGKIPLESSRQAIWPLMAQQVFAAKRLPYGKPFPETWIAHRFSRALPEPIGFDQTLDGSNRPNSS